jgi:hypothetical protein
VSTLTDDLLTTEEVAKLLRVDPSTVRRWRTSRPVQGPPFIQMSERLTLYAPEDVRLWLSRRRIDPMAA